MISLEFNQIFILFINVLGVIVGKVVFFENPRLTLNRLFTATILLMLLWVNFAYFPRLIGQTNPQLALTLLKIAWFVTPPFFTLLYFLAVFLTDSQHKYRKLHILIGILGVSSASITGFSDLVVSGIHFVHGP